MHLFSFLLFSLLGLAFGSFINALVYRLEKGESLLGRSFCPHCRKQLSWFDNIPLVSFVWLRGKCRHCSRAISWRYPLIEGATAASFLFIGFSFFSPENSATWLSTMWLFLVATFLIALAAYDLSYMEVLILPIIGGVGVVLAVLCIQNLGTPWMDQASPLFSGIVGGTALSALFFLLVFLSRETWMGWGDVWVGFLVGLIVGWPSVFFLLTIASSLGALVGIMIMHFGEKNMKSAVPFVPFLVAGTILTLCLEKQLQESFPFFFL